MPTKTNNIKLHLTMAAIALLFIQPGVMADNKELALYEGDWTGFYRPDMGEWEKAKFIVKESESNTDKKPGLSLTLQLGYFPKEDWKFEAKDLDIDSDSVKFQFGKDSFQLKCDLEKNKDLELIGNCKPIDKNAGGTASKIWMVPPQSEKTAESKNKDKTKNKKEKKKKKSK